MFTQEGIIPNWEIWFLG